MKREITVDKALKMYFLKNSIMYLIGGIIVFALVVILSNYFSGESVIIITILLTLIGIVLFAILSIPISNTWKFWAFSRVNNVHELKKRFILLREISGQEIFFKRIENSAEHDTKYWKLRLKFAKKDIFEDDETIPDETVIYNSKAFSITIVVLSIFIFAGGIFFLVTAAYARVFVGFLLFGVFLIILALFLGYRHGYEKLKNKEPQLVLNSKGINSNKTGFHKWEEIKNEFIYNDSRDGFLSYTHSRGYERIKTSNLTIHNGIILSKLLMVYRERNKLKNCK